MLSHRLERFILTVKETIIVEKPELNNGKMLFSQNADSCSEDDYQSLEVEVRDGGAGKYFVIKTDSWAFDSVEELIEILNRVKLAFDF